MGGNADGRTCVASAETLGGMPAGRFAGIAGDVAPADRRNRCRRCEQRAEENPEAKLLMTQPGVVPKTALAYVLTSAK